jgi:hypothetical protein
MEPQKKQPVLTLLDDRPVTLYLLYLQRRLVLLGRGMKDKKTKKEEEFFNYVLSSIF